MSERVALVTGASSGIGKVTALRLAAQGYHVFAAARHLEPIDDIRVTNLEPLHLDVTSEDSIKEALGTVMAHAERIDVLVNNAGFGAYGTLEEMSLEDAQKQFDVNVFGLMRLTKAVLPTMRRQRGGYIVNVSSVAGKLSIPMMGWYSASKHALEALSDSLRLEVKPFGIKVVLVEPGNIKTNFQETAEAQSQDVQQLDAYKGLRAEFKAFSRENSENGAEPYAVASVIEKAVTSERPQNRYVAPFKANYYTLARRVFGDWPIDFAISRSLKWR